MGIGSVSIWQILALSCIVLPAVLWGLAKRKARSPWVALLGLLPLINIIAVIGLLLAEAKDPKQ